MAEVEFRVRGILRRDGTAGPEVLLSRRAGQVYATGLWHLPSGHLDGPHEDVVAALIRKAAEETGVAIDLADVRFAVTVHHRSPGGSARIGVFFEVRHWQGTPQILEPAMCDAMDWYRLDDLPSTMVAYCRAGLDAYRAGDRLAVHFQQPADPIPYATTTDRLRQIPKPATLARTGPRRRYESSPSGRLGASPTGRTCPGRGRAVTSGEHGAPRAAYGSSKSTKTTAFMAGKSAPTEAGFRLWEQPRPGW